MNPFDVSSTDLTRLSSDELRELAADIAVEQHRRALERADPSALIDDAFDRAFLSGRAQVVDPWIVDGILVCPGALVQTSKSGSHDCTFVSVKLPHSHSSEWVFEAGDMIDDDVRFLPGNVKTQRSITLIVATEGLEVDVVVARQRSGQHKMKQVRSFKVDGGQLELVTTRAQAAAGGHR